MKNSLIFVFACVFSVSAWSKTNEEISRELNYAQSTYLNDKCAMNSVATWLKIRSQNDVATVAANILGQKGYKYYGFNVYVHLSEQNSKLTSVQLMLPDVPEAVMDVDVSRMVGKTVVYNTEDIKKNKYLNFAVVDQSLNLHIIQSILIGQSSWLKNRMGLNSYYYSKDYLKRLWDMESCPLAK